MRKNILFGIMIAILCTTIGIGVGYFISNKAKDNVYNNDNISDKNTESDNDQNENNLMDSNNHVELEENLKIELKNVFKFVYDYYDWSNAYCGSYGDDGLEVPNPTYPEYPTIYVESSQYTSFNQMINHLKEYMTESVIYEKKTMSSDNYIEKNGKLYCEDFGKGGGYYQLEDITIKYSNPQDSTIDTIIETKLIFEEETEQESYHVQFINQNNRWIISLYEKSQK